MRSILIIGAGKSTSALIQYLQNKSDQENLRLIIADLNLEQAQKLAGNHKNSQALKLDIFNENDRKSAISEADIVISMLPARFHIEVAKDCISL